MDGLTELVPPTTTFTVAGRSFTIGALRLADYSEAGAHLLQFRPTLDTVLPKVLASCGDADAKKHVAGLAFTRMLRGHTIPNDELTHWFNSDAEGVIWFWWLRLKRYQNVTRDEVETILTMLTPEEMWRINELLPEGPLGNSLGAATEPSAAPGPGDESSASSPKNTG